MDTRERRPCGSSAGSFLFWLIAICILARPFLAGRSSRSLSPGFSDSLVAWGSSTVSFIWRWIRRRAKPQCHVCHFPRTRWGLAKLINSSFEFPGIWDLCRGPWALFTARLLLSSVYADSPSRSEPGVTSARLVLPKLPYAMGTFSCAACELCQSCICLTKPVQKLVPLDCCETSAQSWHLSPFLPGLQELSHFICVCWVCVSRGRVSWTCCRPEAEINGDRFTLILCFLCSHCLMNPGW